MSAHGDEPEVGRQAAGQDSSDLHRNEVRLCGRVSAPAQERVLPSGDRLWTVRVIVDRPPQRQRGRSRIDTIDCVAWGSRAQRSVAGWQPGDVVEVSGALRRRFHRGEAGPVSRFEVEIERAKKVRA